VPRLRSVDVDNIAKEFEDMNGKVKQLVAHRGFGFVTAEDGASLFFHMTDAPEFNDLQEGDPVRFEEFLPVPEKGRRAHQVERIPASVPAPEAA
jgi:cold shock CspA family protein